MGKYARFTVANFIMVAVGAERIATIPPALSARAISKRTNYEVDVVEHLIDNSDEHNE